MTNEEQQQIKEARELLKKHGYQTANLWTVGDVQSKFNCTNDEAMIVIEKALINPATMDQIWFAIDYHGDECRLNKLED